jgi:flagellar basal-body rod protein FlgC
MADPIRNSTAAMSIAASALHAEDARMRVIAENIANSDSTATTAGGDPYQRQLPIFEPAVTNAGGTGVHMKGVRRDMTPFKMEYNPSHPAADAKGYVKMPNVDPLTESLDMRRAQRAYDANLNMIETLRVMDARTLDIIRK